MLRRKPLQDDRYFIKPGGPSFTNPGGPAGPIHVVDPDFIKDLEKVFKRTPTCHTYSMSHLDKNYDTAQVGSTFMNWGMHALQWKGYNHIDQNPGGAGTFDADLANALGPPGEDSGASGTPPSPNHVSCHGAERLDELEQASSGIFRTNGNPTDPIGSWNCVEEPDPFSAAVLGAMNMFYWNTPTYVDFTEATLCTDFPCSIEAVVMKEVTLCAEGPEAPHVACNWGDNAGAEVGSCEATLVLESMICGFFHGPPDPYSPYPPDHYYEDEYFFDSNSVGMWLYGAYGNWHGDTAELVFDPPAGTDVAALQERAHLTASKVLDPSELASMIKRANSDTKGSIRDAAPGGKKK